MRIGITCYPTYGGSGVVATELGQELAARGHDIHFISYAPPIRMNTNDPHIHFHEVEVASYPLFDHPPYTLALATKMLEVFEAEALDYLLKPFGAERVQKALARARDFLAGGPRRKLEKQYAGLLRATRAGRYIRYAVDVEGMRKLLTYLTEDCCQGNPELCGSTIKKARKLCKGETK